METIKSIAKKLFVIWLAILVAFIICIGIRMANDIHSISLQIEEMNKK
jgi:hypothetical protein